MERVAADDLDPAASAGGAVRVALSDALGTTDVAINRYRPAPGERISGLHAHGDQEEVFLVVEGAVTFETYDVETESADAVTVEPGEAIRFGPGEYQTGRNAGDAPAACYALGAPRDSEDVRVPLSCPDCGHDHLEPTLGDDHEPVLACPDCGAETPVECPDCGGVAMYAVLGADDVPVSTCRDCGYTSETP
jgi:uncharacterized cupin superfamily protein